MKTDLPWGLTFNCSVKDADLIIMGVPFDGAASNEKGAATAPDRLRELSRILPLVTEQGWVFNDLKIWDAGDVALDLNWERFFGEVNKRAYDNIVQGKFCLFLGGDHSVSIPLESAFARANDRENVGIIHLDAHCDLADKYDGHHWSHACTQRRALELPNLKPGQLTLVGVRSFMDDELEFLAEHPEIRVIGAREIYKQGIERAINTITARYRDCRNIYCSIDIDILDPGFAPGTGTPEGGGLSTRELMEMVREIMANLPVKAVDVVEISPPLDSANITAWAALKVIYEIFGEISQHKTKMAK